MAFVFGSVLGREQDGAAREAGPRCNAHNGLQIAIGAYRVEG